MKIQPKNKKDKKLTTYNATAIFQYFMFVLTKIMKIQPKNDNKDIKVCWSWILPQIEVHTITLPNLIGS